MHIVSVWKCLKNALIVGYFVTVTAVHAHILSSYLFFELLRYSL